MSDSHINDTEQQLEKRVSKLEWDFHHYKREVSIIQERTLNIDESLAQINRTLATIRSLTMGLTIGVLIGAIVMASGGAVALGKIILPKLLGAIV